MNRIIKRLISITRSQKVIYILINLFLFFILCHRFSTKAIAAIKKTFTPRISIQREYDDNIDLAPNIKRSEWITTVSPGFSLTWDYPRTVMSLDYETGLIFYQDDSSRDNISHRGNGHWEKQLSRHIRLEVIDTFTYSEDPILEGEEGQIEEIIRNRRIYYINDGNISLSWQFGVGSQLSLSYGNRYFDNKPVDFQDSVSQDFFINLDTQFNPKFGIGLTSSINRGKFKHPERFEENSSKNFYDYGGTFTLNYRWNPYRHLYLKYSLLNKDFDDPGEEPNKIGFWLHQVDLGFNFVLSTYTDLNIEGGYFQQDHINGNEQNGVSYNALLSTQKKKTSFSLGGSGGYDQDYFSSENLGSSKSNQIFGSVNYQYTKNFRSSVSANYQWKSFFGEDAQRDRKDEVWLASAAFSLSFWRRFTLSLTGTHTERKSSDRTAEFEDNRVMLRLTGAYPILF